MVKLRISFGAEVGIAIIAGIFVGLFLGPWVKVFKPVSDIFIMLLQMVVLPYICISIIHGLGSVTPQVAAKLFKKAWSFWLFLWGTMFFIIFLFYQLVPKPLSGILVQENAIRKEGTLAQNIIAYLIPENPFYDLVNNIVPGIAMFGIIAGIALMHIRSKEPMLGFLERSIEVIEKILQWIAIISPIGVFAHLATVTGTVFFEDLVKLEFYVGCFIVVTLILTLWILPMILTSFTDLSIRESLRAFRAVCLLSFATGLPTIAIPFLNMHLRKVEQKFHLDSQRSFRNTSQTVMPLSYAFAQIGNAMILFFILFISFYYRHPFSEGEKLSLSLLTIPLSIGSSTASINAVAFLISQLGFPEKAVELFTQTMAVTMHFQVLVSVASVLTFSLLVLFAYYNHMKIKWNSFLLRFGATFALLTVVVFVIKPFIHLGDNYRNLYVNLQIKDVIDNPVDAKIFLQGETIPEPVVSGEKTIEQILRSRTLRVGYHPKVIPYCYFNEAHELVGYDIAMAYQLARDLDCNLEFIPINIDRLGEEINAHRYELAMSAIIMSEERIQALSFSNYYSEQDSILIVPLKKKAQFAKLSQVAKNMSQLRIGATGAYKGVYNRHFSKATLVEGDLEDLVEGKADAWIWSRTLASIWCLSHPDFVVVNYGDLLGKYYFAYPTEIGSVEFIRFLNQWMTLKSLSGFTQVQYNYWILGEKPATNENQRWSILRNVLHWIK